MLCLRVISLVIGNAWWHRKETTFQEFTSLLRDLEVIMR